MTSHCRPSPALPAWIKALRTQRWECCERFPKEGRGWSGWWLMVSHQPSRIFFSGFGGSQFYRGQDAVFLTWRWKKSDVVVLKTPSCVGILMDFVLRSRFSKVMEMVLSLHGAWIRINGESPCRQKPFSQAPQTCSERDGNSPHVIEVEKEDSFWSLQMNMFSTFWLNHKSNWEFYRYNQCMLMYKRTHMQHVHTPMELCLCTVMFKCNIMSKKST